ncbi:MAG TPA: hypothetical protein VF916_07785 [Ktedonobacterales bacterium]
MTTPYTVTVSYETQPGQRRERRILNSSAITQEALAELLREAEAAHGQYEAGLGHPDPDWPTWYAAFIVAKLQQPQGQAADGAGE